MKIIDDNLRLINEAIEKQLEDAGKDIMDAVPEAEKLLEAIKKVYPKGYKKHKNNKIVPEEV